MAGCDIEFGPRRSRRLRPRVLAYVNIEEWQLSEDGVGFTVDTGADQTVLSRALWGKILAETGGKPDPPPETVTVKTVGQPIKLQRGPKTKLILSSDSGPAWTLELGAVLINSKLDCECILGMDVIGQAGLKLRGAMDEQAVEPKPWGQLGPGVV